MPPVIRKRSAANGGSTAQKKKSRTDVSIKVESGGVGASGERSSISNSSSSSSSSSSTDSQLRDRFIRLLSQDAEHSAGISNSLLKEKFGNAEYLRLVPIINALTAESRLVMSKGADKELYYSMVSESIASKFQGLDAAARMVYQVIERVGDKGIWTRDIRNQTNISNPTLINKIFKSLESRQLIKPVKSVQAKQKKLYMLYDLQPSKELTGGVWYSDLEFDHEFISELRNFVMHCVRRLNGGRGITLSEIREKMIQARISRIQLSLSEVEQLVQTLIYDYIVEETTAATAVEVELSASSNVSTVVKYVAARRVTPMCEFKWWDAVEPDFYFRAIDFEDGITLPPHEYHYHTP